MSLRLSSDDSISPKYPALPIDNLCTRQIAKRWSVLAEQRLDYLTELFDTGRWRRFHNEQDFLDNVQEAKASVERWRAMADGHFVMPEISPTARIMAPVVNVVPPVADVVLPAADAVPYEPPVFAMDDATIAGGELENDAIARVLPHLVVVNDAPVAEEVAVQEAAVHAHLDLFDRDAIVERYPMLRAAM